MSYNYVRRVYGVNPIPGERVRHTELRGPGSLGTITRERPSQGHHVMVRFDGRKHADPCHPTALEYLGPASDGGEG